MDPGKAQNLSPRGSVEISIDRKRPAEELPEWEAKRRDSPTPGRKPRHHVFGYRERDPVAEAEILHETDGFARWKIGLKIG